MLEQLISTASPRTPDYLDLLRDLGGYVEAVFEF